jgi:hypothetical protein
MPPKQCVDKQTQTTKQVEKNSALVNNIMLNPHEKKCEIPNYAQIIRDHKRNHLEYYKELQSMRSTEHD